MYKNHLSNFYDDLHVESYNPKQSIDELEHTSLITYWTSNMYEDAYIKKSENKLIVTLTGTTGRRVLNKSFCGSYFRMF